MWTPLYCAQSIYSIRLLLKSGPSLLLMKRVARHSTFYTAKVLGPKWSNGVLLLEPSSPGLTTAIINAKDRYGRTALDVAAMQALGKSDPCMMLSRK